MVVYIVKFPTIDLSVSFFVKGNGLRVKQACTLISDTVCEPLPGYYCIDVFSNCKKAMKHSSCSPGQYVNQTGQSFISQTALIYIHKN